MGDTHFRSNVKEHGARTASFSTIQGATISGTNVRGTNYFRLGTDVYIISGVPAAFTNAGISLAATSNSGITSAGLGEGTMFLSASLNHPASTCFMKTAPATWCNVQSGNELG